MGVKIRRLFSEFCDKDLKITWLIFLLALVFNIETNEKNQIRSIDERLSKHNKSIIIIGLIGVTAFGSIFYYFNLDNINIADSVGVNTFINLNFMLGSLLFLSMLTFLFGLTSYIISKDR